MIYLVSTVLHYSLLMVNIWLKRELVRFFKGFSVLLLAPTELLPWSNSNDLVLPWDYLCLVPDNGLTFFPQTTPMNWQSKEVSLVMCILIAPLLNDVNLK